MAGGSELALKDLPEKIAGSAERNERRGGTEESVRGLREREELEAALRNSRGRIADALKILGMNRSTFYYRLKLYGIHPADFRHGMAEGSGGGQFSASALEPLLSLNHEELTALEALARQLCRNRNGV